ncbi:MAG: 6-phosphofructokinase [Candidatus Aminicenantes bacterium]|nr:6-phosphofructokinase [Candidatus Aminicenantes bacterium]
MNAAIRSVVRSGIYMGFEVYGVFHGYDGLIEGVIKKMNCRSVGNIINRGGTFLKTARSHRFLTPEGRKKAVISLKDKKIDALIVIGGNGSFRGAQELYREHKIPVIGIPATIDNDCHGTDFSIGTDTAVNVAMEAIDKIRDTAFSLERLFVIEVMGRHLGYIALQVGVAAGVEEVLVPEFEFDMKSLVKDIKKGHRKGKFSWMIVVAEGAASANDIARQIFDLSGFRPRVTVLGYLQRGGSPTAMDRILATRFGKAAVDAIARGDCDKMVAMSANTIQLIDFKTACSGKKDLNRDDYNLIKILAI